MSDEPITLDALKGFVQPIHVRMIFKELTHRMQDLPEYAQAHPIQKICCANMYQNILIVNAKDLPDGARAIKEAPFTICGIPFAENREMKDDVIEFVRGGRVVAKIFNLAKPPGL